MSPDISDIWSRWLLNRRFGGNWEQMEAALERLAIVRENVLAHVLPGDNGGLLDVGCGDGLLAFGALSRFPGCQVVFSDISAPLLEEARSVVDQMGVGARCRLIQALAEDLTAVEDGSVDAVTTRSVLI
jgi:ubiquinone/menaquinone biosynthesis C-methylase UbiE